MAYSPLCRSDASPCPPVRWRSPMPPPLPNRSKQREQRGQLTPRYALSGFEPFDGPMPLPHPGEEHFGAFTMTLLVHVLLGEGPPSNQFRGVVRPQRGGRGYTKKGGMPVTNVYFPTTRFLAKLRRVNL